MDPHAPTHCLNRRLRHHEIPQLYVQQQRHSKQEYNRDEYLHRQTDIELDLGDLVLHDFVTVPPRCR